MNNIFLSANTAVKCFPDDLTNLFNEYAAQKAYSFHRTFPDYKPTPLVELKELARELRVNKIYIKDESFRFGLNAFKVLGASYAIATHLAETLPLEDSPLSFEIFNDPAVRNKIKEITFVTATDGNHGRGVAWTAMKLGCRAVVYMPKVTTLARFNAIKNLGAEVTIIEGTHTDAVNLASESARKFGWLLVQDTAWPGYTDIPTNIMRGYLTIWKEFIEQSGNDVPTHIFIQCGVGSLPAAILGHTVELYGANKPKFINVEPLSAGCVHESYLKGHSVKIENEMNTIMAGLACDTPSSVALEILANHCEFFISCEDDATTAGMRLLGNPAAGNPKIISGESGAVTTGLLIKLLSEQANEDNARLLGLNENSRIFLISTEGNTDPEHYSKILSQSDYQRSGK